MSRHLFLFTAIGAAAVVALAFHAVAQPPATAPRAGQPPATELPTGTVIVESSDGTVVEQTLEGKILRTTAPRYPQANNLAPSAGGDGRAFLAVHGSTQDAESLKLAAQERAAADEARVLAGQYIQADSEPARAEAKSKLRAVLAAIFDFQQQRRAREIAQIEERLGKLKETMKKRDASKDPIIDRRVEQLTGGIDELGWEETGGHQPNFTAPYPYSPGISVPGPPNIPGTVPGRGLPSATPPLLPSPVPVGAGR